MEVYYNNSISKNAGPAAQMLFENPFETILEDMLPVGTLRDSTYEIVGPMAYLIGVRAESIREYPQYKFFAKLDSDKNARIIRHLCICRTSIERNFKKISDAMAREYRLIENMPDEWLPSASMAALKADGVSFVKKSSTKLAQHLIEINRLISDRINNCRSLFPDWVPWDYIKDLFIMPNGLTENGTKAAADLYYAHKFNYPYQCYINWRPYEAGNVLTDDRRFMTFLYEQHNDYFTEYSQTSDAGSLTKNRIYSFLSAAHRVVALVDCENVDPYKFCASLRSLAQEELDKISKIILFDDVHASTAWAVLERFTSIPVEYLMVERIHAGKSLVDGKLIARASKEFYKNDTDSFLLVSSDSDYWSLISDLDGANFLVMIESEKTSSALKTGLEERQIPYCYLDDFYLGGAEELKTSVVQAEISRQLDACTFDLEAMLTTALTKTRASMSEIEQKRFMEKLVGRLTIVVDDIKHVHIELKK